MRICGTVPRQAICHICAWHPVSLREGVDTNEADSRRPSAPRNAQPPLIPNQLLPSVERILPTLEHLNTIKERGCNIKRMTTSIDKPSGPSSLFVHCHLAPPHRSDHMPDKHKHKNTRTYYLWNDWRLECRSSISQRHQSRRLRHTRWSYVPPCDNTY